MASGGIKTTDALLEEALSTAEGLGRPLRYVQLNSFYNGSTGSIMRGLHSQLSSCGVDSYCFWGRRHETINDHMACCASRSEVYLHGAMTRLFDRMGFYSKRDTNRLLARLDEIDPDVVHLHNIHGYYVNIEMLFSWLASHHCQVRWTLHDCWALTGHCAYFTYAECAQWQSHCAHSKLCPQLDTYPKTICKTNCARNFEDKRRIFTMVPPERMTLITPSQWLANLVGKSFLKGYPVEVRHNTVDKTVFKPTPSDFRERYGIGDRFIVLGVASPWTARKGLGDFVRLAREFDSGKFAIVLVGLSDSQIRQISNQLLAPLKAEGKEGLAGGCGSAGMFEPSDLGAVSGGAAVKTQARDAPVAMIEDPVCTRAAGSDTVGAIPADLSTLQATVLNLAGSRVILMTRTDSAAQLAAIYTAADVLFNPTMEDNYPTVNLEAEACGTPVVTYGTGGCAETLACRRSVAVDGFGSAHAALARLMQRKDLPC